MPQNYNISDAMISYSRKDKEFVNRLEQALVDAGRKIWVDWDDIAGTIDWWAEIQAGIEAAHSFIFVITPNSIRSDICRKELEHAIKHGKRLIPIMREAPVEQADKDRMHPMLNQHNWIKLTDADDFRTGVKTLIQTLETDVDHANMHTRLLVRAREWEVQDHKPSLLLRGDDLTKAESWLGSGLNKEPAPTALQAEFIAASRRAATRSRRFVITATTLTMLSLGLLSLLALTATATAIDARDIAATQQEIAIDSIASAEYAKGQAEISENALATQQINAATSQAGADIAGTLAVDYQLTAYAAATNAAEIQLTADAAATEAAAAQATAGTAAANLQLTSNAAGTEAAIANQEARNAQARADAAGTAATLANGTAVGAQQTAMAQGTSAAIAQQTSDAQLMSVAKTLEAQRRAVEVANEKATQAALELTAIYIQGEAQKEQLVSLSLADAARRALASGNRPLAMHLVLLAAKRPGMKYPADLSIEQAFHDIAYSSGVRKTLTSINDNIQAAAFNEEKQIVALGLKNGSIEVRSAQTGALIVPTWKPDISIDGLPQIMKIALSPDGTKVAYSSVFNTLSVLDVQSNSIKRLWYIYRPYPGTITFSPDSKYFIVGGTDGKIDIWNTQSGEHIGEWYQNARINSFAFSPDGTKMIVGGEAPLGVWNYDNGMITHVSNWTANGEVLSVSSLSFSNDGTKLATASYDTIGYAIRIWNVETGTVIGGAGLGHTEPILSLAFSSDERYLVSTSNDMTLRVWEVAASPQLIWTGPLVDIRAAIFSFDGRYALSVVTDRTLNVWDPGIPQTDGAPWLSVDGSPVSAIARNQEGTQIVTGTEWGILQLWNIPSGQSVRSVRVPIYKTSKITSVAFSPVGQYVVLGLANGEVYLWDKDTEGSEPFFLMSTSPVNGVAYSSDGKYIAIGAGALGSNGTLKIWDLDNNKELRSFTLNSAVRSIAIGPATTCLGSSTCVAAGLENGTILLWDLKSGKLFKQPAHTHSDAVLDLEFSPAGKCALTSTQMGTCLVSASADRTLMMWDIMSGARIGNNWLGHTHSVNSATFSPNGQYVISASEDGALQLWDARTHEPIGKPWLGNTKAVTSITFSLDGQYVVSGAKDGTLRKWLVRTMPQMITWVCTNRYARYLTPQELAAYGVTQDIPKSQCAAIDDTAPKINSALQADASLDMRIPLAPEATQESTQEPGSDAVIWIPSGGWMAQEDGWLLEGTREMNSLTSDRAIDLNALIAPQLQFSSLLQATVSLGTVQYSIDGQKWELLMSLNADDDPNQIIDLSSYVGQSLWLQFVWFDQASQGSAPESWHLSNIAIIEAEPLSPLATVEAQPTVEVMMTEEPVSVQPTVEVISSEEPGVQPTIEVVISDEVVGESQTNDTVVHWIPSGSWISEGAIWRVAGGESSSMLASSQVFNLANMTAPQLHFDSFYDGTAPLARVYIQREGADWDLLFIVPTTVMFTPQTVDLSLYVGQSIRLAFVWAADEPPLGTESWQISAIAVVEAQVGAAPDPSIPVVLPTFTPSPTAFISEPPLMPSPTPFPLTLPLFASMDDGAHDWSISEGWSLSDALYMDQVSLAWQLSSQVSNATLSWTSRLDLRQAVAPQLYFHSRMGGDLAATVQISIDERAWQTLAVVDSSPDWTAVQIDLQPYVGHVIRLQWGSTLLATSPDTVVWMIDNVSVMEAAPKPVEEVVVSPTPTATPSLTPTITLMPTLTETPIALELAATAEIMPEMPVQATAETSSGD